MAKYDDSTPKDILNKIRLKKEEGYFVQRIQDKKHLAQYYEIVLKDKKSANKIYDEIRLDLDKKLSKSPKGSPKKMAQFLRDLQNQKTGSFVDYPTTKSLELERARTILRNLKQEGLKPKYPLRFLDNFNTGNKLKNYFNSLLYNFSKNNADELNLVITGLPVIKDLGFHSFSRDWEKAYYQCLAMWQDTKTGYWGQWVKKANKIEKLSELSTTFHILRIYYNKDNLKLNNSKYALKYKNKIIQTTFKIKNKNYPYGWLEKGNWSMHHNFDVAEIFLYLFKDMNIKQKKETRVLFHNFLIWSLSNLHIEGGFIENGSRTNKPSIYNTHFAILLLRALGYYSSFYRAVIWKGINLPINSYRIYKTTTPKNELDTLNLTNIVYNQKSSLDPLDTRKRIYSYWKKHKHEDLSHAMNTNSVLKFNEYPISKFKILSKLPQLKKGEILVAVDEFGGVIWSKCF